MTAASLPADTGTDSRHLRRLAVAYPAFDFTREVAPCDIGKNWQRSSLAGASASRARGRGDHDGQ